MTPDTLTARRAALVQQRDQHMANVNATAGAIALCDELIAEMVAAAAPERLPVQPEDEARKPALDRWR